MPSLKLQTYLAGLVWLCVTPLLVLGTWQAIDHVRDVHEHVESSARLFSTGVAADIDQELRARGGALGILAASEATGQHARHGELYQEAQAYQRAFDSHVVLVDERERIHFTTRLPYGAEMPALPRPGGHSAVQQVMRAGQMAVGDLFTSPAPQRQPMVALGVPAGRAEGLALVMVATIAAESFGRHLQAAALPPGWRLALNDSQGAVIALRGPTQFDADQPLQRRVVRVEGAPWTVVLEVPQAVYRAPVLRAATVGGSALLLIALTSVLGGIFAARRLTRSIQALAHADQAPSGGEVQEVNAVRERLREAARLRATAEAERRDSEQRHRAKMEQAAIRLAVSEARLRGIFDTASDGIVTVDESQHIVMANRAALKMFGHEAQALQGQPLDLLLPARFRERHRSQVTAFGDAEAPPRTMSQREPVLGLRANGEEFPVQAAISHVHVDGQRFYTVILRDVTEMLRVRAELEASHAALRRLVAARDNVQENERKRIARELHDDLQQTLAAIKMDCTAIRRELDVDPARIPPMLAKIDELASAAIASTRRIVNDLRPQILEDLGLPAALEGLASEFARRHGIRCQVLIDAADTDADAIAPAVATCVYRVAQESLNNVVKHAGATQVRLQLEGAGPGRVRLRVHDNGRGLEPGARQKRHALGLLGMSERLRAVGGSLRVHSTPDEGTTVEAEVPTAGEAPTTVY